MENTFQVGTYMGTNLCSPLHRSSDPLSSQASPIRLVDTCYIRVVLALVGRQITPFSNHLIRVAIIGTDPSPYSGQAQESHILQYLCKLLHLYAYGDYIPCPEAS